MQLFLLLFLIICWRTNKASIKPGLQRLAGMSLWGRGAAGSLIYIELLRVLHAVTYFLCKDSTQVPWGRLVRGYMMASCNMHCH